MSDRLHELHRAFFPHMEVRCVESLKGGLSESPVYAVTLEPSAGFSARQGDPLGIRSNDSSASIPGTRRIVIKYGPKVIQEVRGYRLLRDRYGDRMPPIIELGGDFIIIGYLDGLGTFADVIRQGLIDEHSIKTMYTKILFDKLERWRTASCRWEPPESSMIRTEFPETRDRLLKYLSSCSNHPFCGLNPQKPMRINGLIYPSFIDILHHLERELTPRNRPVIACHGDLKPENIVIIPERNNGQTFRYIDFEWSGRYDIVEALMRLGKWCSSKTLTRFHVEHCCISCHCDAPEACELRYELSFPDIYHELETIIQAFVPRVGDIIGDPDVRRWYDLYIAASLLREIVLLQKRGLAETLSWALLGEVMKMLAPYIPHSPIVLLS